MRTQKENTMERRRITMKKADIGLIGLAVMGEKSGDEYGIQRFYRGGI